MDSVIGASRTSPAALKSPPMMARSGFKTLQRFASATPMLRPASAITRCASESPECASSISSAVAHRGGSVHADPARQDRGRPDGPVRGRYRTREPHAHAEHLLAIDARVVEGTFDELAGQRETVARGGVDVEVAP